MPYNEAASNTGSFLLRRIGLPSTLPTIGNVFSLNSGTTIIGRNPTTSDIFLDSAVHKALISRLHARITTDQNASKVTICDTSLNGTYVNDKKILDTEEIKVGDTITFGHLKGAVLEPGVVAKQHKSEFMFKLEKCAPQMTHHSKEEHSVYPCNINNSEGYIQERIGLLPDLSPFLNSTEEDSCESQNIEKQQTPKPCLLKTDGINLQKETSENLDLIQDSEDEDEISIIQTYDHKETNLASKNSTETSRNTHSAPYYNMDLPSERNVRDPKKTIEIADATTVPLNGLANDMLRSRNALTNIEHPQVFIDDGKSLKRPKKGRPSKKRKSLKATSNYEKNVPETCGFKSDCLRPHDREELVEWVQCDYCKKWYHLECTGLTLDKVSTTAVKFNCGCVYIA
ncbi:uncharacterized protein LOC110254025 [Exaiptasia diaphana]|uniref:FHA domain-containing protein n=1 Tax=Exaiptasia diaphana TaxID=2652724 RepID=A0A913YA44_EXADI|nr:uncharacterized protein LOC110254025 [Exaiptasia diaphana]KXJ21551.1 Uncharacterized protein C01G6.5 [Exaiptasia diaphana]